MNTRWFSRAIAAVAVFSLCVGVLPQSARAAGLSAPENVMVVGGKYTNDTTPTFTWNRPASATWYEVAIDERGWIGISNVNSYTTTWALRDGWHGFYVRAHDNAGHVSTSGSVIFEIDTQGAFVPGITPTSARQHEAVTFSVTPYGEAAVVSCDLFVNNHNVGAMTKYANTFRKTYTFTAPGAHSVYAGCWDGDRNYSVGAQKNVMVSPRYPDAPDVSETFFVGLISPSIAIEDEKQTFHVRTNGTLHADSCLLYINGESKGYMNEISSNRFSLSYTFPRTGSYSVYAYCEDENGDWERGNTTTITVRDAVEEDDDTVRYLTVGRVTPSRANEDERTEFTVDVEASYNVTQCWLYVDGDRVAEMDEESTNTFTADYTFRNTGNYSVFASCKDSRGNSDDGEKRTVRVDSEDDSDDSSDDGDDSVRKGSLIKTACGHTVAVNDPCTAVYYYGEDGRRHVFPNASVYFTWYSNFNDVIEVSSSFMSSLTIGKNVTYHPGSVLVKFEGSSSIYAVEAPKTLRRYTTIGLLEADYGKHWEKSVVEISDSLYNNYTIGSVIDDTNDYDADDEQDSVDSIDDVM